MEVAGFESIEHRSSWGLLSEYMASRPAER
jgi:hypothetical protein